MIPIYPISVILLLKDFFFILSFFNGYILSFSLVRFRTIRLSAQVGTHIECRCSRSRGEDVTITDVIIKTQGRKMWLGMWMTSYLEMMGWGFGVTFEKKQLVEIQTWASPVGSTRCAACGGVSWNSQHSRNCVSPPTCRKT